MTAIQPEAQTPESPQPLLREVAPGAEYPHQFTVRSGTRRGGPSELQKVVNGYGDWMFYGHADPAGALASWYLLDLRSFRAGLIRHSNGGPRVCWGDQKNADGTPFRWFDVRSFLGEPKLVVASNNTLAA